MRSITLGSNIASLQGVRRLSENADALSQTFERLSSGMRINRASDDAAGLAVQSALNVDRRVYSQGVRNINDGLSLLNIADSTLSNASSIVTRLTELAEQAANGTFGLSQRESLNSEAQALASEYLRITRSATFNGISLFDGSLQGLRVQGGYGTDGSIFSRLGGGIWNGTFGSTTSITGAIGGSDIKTSDLNGDGIQDLVNTTGTGISVQLGNGDGSFLAAISYDMGVTSTLDVELSDINGDGRLDAIVGGANGGVGIVGIRFGQGDGTFGAATTLTTSLSAVHSIAVGDLDRDGIADLAVGGAIGTASKVNLFMGTGNGTFSTYKTYSGSGLTATGDVQLVDLNSDGFLDLISTGSGSGAPQVSLNNGNGTFGTPLANVGYGINAARFADINGDGKKDIITVNAGVVIVGFGNGDGTFGAGNSLTAGQSIVTLEIADINGDGIQDIAAGSRFGPSVLLGNGNGTFSGPISTSIMLNTISDFTIADINNDGVLDFLGANTSDGVRLSLSNTKDGIGSILSFSLNSIADARQALSQFSNLSTRLSNQRGTIGAFQSRMNVASAVLSVAAEQSAAAESRILDVDVAQESAELTRRKILQQSSAAILAQANQQPKIALSLLRI